MNSISSKSVTLLMIVVLISLPASRSYGQSHENTPQSIDGSSLIVIDAEAYSICEQAIVDYGACLIENKALQEHKEHITRPEPAVNWIHIALAGTAGALLATIITILARR